MKKIIAISITILLSATLCACGHLRGSSSTAGTGSNQNSSIGWGSNKAGTTSEAVSTAAPQPTIIPTAASQTTLVPYSTEDFSMQIPSGWTVTTGGTGMIHSVRVYAPVLSNPSTQGFFEIFSSYADYVEKDEPTYAGYEFPRFNDFNTLESFETNNTLGDASYAPAMLHATFTDANGTAGEGMFTADVLDFTGNTAVMGNIDAGFYMAYTIMAVTAVENEFVEWEDLLCQCINSIDYTDNFVNNAIAQSNEMVVTSQKLSQSFNEIADGIMDSWNQRNASEDILRQKQSDAILGYERVYNTDNGEIYKAYNGFTDDFSYTNIEPISDDMYTQPIDGYIE